jgi:penicillin-insensitive murein endopeptidase
VAPLRSFVLAALLLAPSAALAGPPPPAPSKAAPAGKPSKGKRTAHVAAPAKAQRHTPGRSVGSPTEGHLIGGAHLPDAPYLRIVPVYAGGDVRWGLEPLVGMIDHAARVVRKQFPDAVLSVGHLSKPGGGELDHHASHESGRDADIAFYIKNQAGKAIFEDHFVAFLGDGTAPTWPGARFDDAKNWALVAAMVSDVQARVTHIFVSTPIRARLLAYAEKIGAPPSVRVRASELMAQPHGSLPHDDHFHVRIACPPGMEKCIELPVARRHGLRHGAVASNQKAPAHHSGATAKAEPGKTAPAKTEPAKAPPAKAEPEAEAKQEKSDSSVPSLAPEVPGLDSAVIAAPLAGVKPSAAPTPPTPPSPPAAQPIDDPDGVLDER